MAQVAPQNIENVENGFETHDVQNTPEGGNGATVEVTEEAPQFTKWKMFVGVVGILTFLFDLGTDFAVAVDYLRMGHTQFAGATFAIMSFSWLVGTIMTLFAWQRENSEYPSLREKREDVFPLGYPKGILDRYSLGYCSRGFFIIILSAPVARTIEYLWVGKALMKPKQIPVEEKKVLEELLVFRQDSASGLRMLEGIFEAFLQLHVQLYAWLTVADLSWDAGSGTLRGLSTAFSWFSISWSLTAWYVAKRKLEMKKDTSKSKQVMHFLYRFAEMGGRTIATAAFASRFGVAWTFIPLAVYFARGLAMSMCAGEREDRERKPLMAIFMFFFSYIHKNEKHKYKKCIYPVVSELINIVIVITMINVWYHRSMPGDVEWRYSAHKAAYGLCMSCAFLPIIPGCCSCLLKS